MIRAAENRRRAAGKDALARAQKVETRAGQKGKETEQDEPPPDLDGWEEFDAEGLLR